MGITTKARILKLCKCIVDPTFRSAFLTHRVAAASEHQIVLSSDLATVVDIGANRGQFSLAARRLSPDAKIFAFEPLAVPAAKFRKLFSEDTKVIFHQAAIGPIEGAQTIHVSAHDDSSSLLPITDVQVKLFPGTKEVSTETVAVGRLNKFLSADDIIMPSMLKIDVQGFELQTLLACDELLDRFNYVYVECSFLELYKGQALADDVIAWLKDRCFIFNGIYNICYDSKGIPIQGDFLFHRNGTNFRPLIHRKTAFNRKTELFNTTIQAQHD